MVNILVVEDDPCVAALYRDEFEAAGFHADIAESGRMAIGKLQSQAPSAVILDLMLGDISGVEVLDYVRSQPAIWMTPVVVLSANHRSPHMRAAWTNGADRCLDKATCSPRRAVEEICSVLRARHDVAAMSQTTADSPGHRTRA